MLLACLTQLNTPIIAQDDVTKSLDQPLLSEVVDNTPIPEEGSIDDEFTMEVSQTDISVSDETSLDHETLIDDSSEISIDASEPFIDVLTSASTTATIDHWVIIDDSINQSSTKISGIINIDHIYNEVIRQGNWINAQTSKDLIVKLFDGQTLELIINGEVKQTKVLRTPSYQFDFTDLDLSAASIISFRLNDILFQGVTKPSALIMNDFIKEIEVPISSLTFGNVEDFSFQPQIFSYNLDKKLINQAHPFSVEIVGTHTGNYSLLVNSSAELSSDTLEVGSDLLYNGQSIRTQAVSILNQTDPKWQETSPITLTFENEFQLKLLNPTELIGDKTYTTTITWTLVNAN